MHRVLAKVRGLVCPVLLLAVCQAQAAREQINGMAGKVSGKILTLRDVRYFSALQRFKENKSDPLAEPSAPEMRSTVQRLLLEEMVFAELKSLRFDGGPRGEAVKVLGAAKSGKAEIWNAILKTYGKTESESVDRIWKSLQVEKFIQRRVETMTPIVTTAEIDQYIRRQAGKQEKRLEQKDVERLRESAGKTLKKELMRRELEEWIVLLKRKYSVVNYLEG